MKTKFYSISHAFFGLVCCVLLLAACGEDYEQQPQNANQQVTKHDCRRNLPPIAQVKSDTTALVSVSFDAFDLVHIGDKLQYNHKRKFREMGGIGGYFYRGRVCVNNASRCVDACVKYRLDASLSFIQNNHKFITDQLQDTISIEYWFRDDNGNLIKTNYTVQTNEDQVFVTK